MNITTPFIFNSTHRGLFCQKYKKTFCHHKILANFHIKPGALFFLWEQMSQFQPPQVPLIWQ